MTPRTPATRAEAKQAKATRSPSVRSGGSGGSGGSGNGRSAAKPGRSRGKKWGLRALWTVLALGLLALIVDWRNLVTMLGRLPNAPVAARASRLRAAIRASRHRSGGWCGCTRR